MALHTHAPTALDEPGRSDPEAAAPATSEPITDRRWFRRLSLGLLLAGTAVLYIWGLSASGYANSFYSAAAQAGAESWQAFFFGSLDASNAITVDKPPASLWLMALSVRIFGLSSWSILVPQALLGVASTGVLYVMVRRISGHWAGLAAGLIMALTPAATLMFRFNNPDALLVFLTILAAYFTLRATEKASGKWLVAAGVLIGFGFLTKMLQAFLILPVFVLVYLIAAPTTAKLRLLHLLAAFGAMIVSLGWWVAIVELVPESWRPYVGGSQNNSILELIFGYNGLGRISGNEVGSVTGGGGMGGYAPGGGAPAGGAWGETGITRLFDGASGGMIAWLIPAALILTVVAMILLGRRPRTSITRASLIIFSGWMIITGLIFSFMAGIYHDYYTVALAPAIAGTVAVGGTILWQQRGRWLARAGLAATMIITAGWAVLLLGRATEPYLSLRWPIAVLGLLAALGLLFGHKLRRVFASLALGIALLAGIAGPSAYAINTAMTPHEGSIVTAGPVSGMNGMRRVGGYDGEDRVIMGGDPGPMTGQNGGAPPQGQGQPGQGQQGQGGPSRTDGGRGGEAGGNSGPGGLLGGTDVSTEMIALLTADADSYKWVAATTGAQSAATYQLATGLPVMAIGGFNGSDPSPTLEEFKALVAEGKIHYYLGSGQGMRSNGGSSASSEIATWVSENFTTTTVGDAEVYDLTQEK